ncbi:hypothetical protein HK100_012451 [Physocladia obscura]|uniref:Uncharacterized protein n=1 Tax=Physocladia obscura TaxID=109957 RepID=A0AAD5T167_9FUNG|nr:hypothetical protein HK100_012451 [Physocladia obscura]
MLEKSKQAEEIVRKQLEDNPKSPKLHCLLGDITKDPQHYYDAWTYSEQKYSRAMRSLGAHYFRSGEFADSVNCYSNALAINPLYENSWFVMGCAALRCEDWKNAQKAFQQTVLLNSDNGEAWTNLANVHVKLGKKREGWRAIREALRQHHDNAKIWDNYLFLSLDLLEFGESVRSMQRIFDIRSNPARAAELAKNPDSLVDLGCLEILVNAVVHDIRSADGVNTAVSTVPQIFALLDCLNSKISGSAKLFTLCAQFYTSQERYKLAIDFLGRAYRVYLHAPALNDDVAVFRAGADAVERLSEAYKELGPLEETPRHTAVIVESDGVAEAGESVLVIVCPDWKYQGRTVLRTFIGRTKDSYEGTPEHERLKELLAMKLPRRIRSIGLAILVGIALVRGAWIARKAFSDFRVAEVDLIQAQLIDFLHGEQLSNHQGVLFGGSVPRAFDFAKTLDRLVFLEMNNASVQYNKSDFLILARRAKTNLIAYKLLYDFYNDSDNSEFSNANNAEIFLIAQQPELRVRLHAAVEDSTHLLYPWLLSKYKSIRDFQNSFKSVARENNAGIVFTTGMWHAELCLHAILSLRTVLNSTLPIEVHYAGPNDLTHAMREAFSRIPDVTTVDITEIFPGESDKVIGWSIKPFAILASRFRQVIFVDADALFFKDPGAAILQESRIYAENGQLFFHDRTLGHGHVVRFFADMNPNPTQFARTLRYMTKRSVHEMESGVVAVDKARTGVLHALLLVCKLNSVQEREVLYKKVHGDKESFWFAWEILRVPYAFPQTFGGTVGYKNELGQICGGLFHTDEKEQPFWWNGGVLKNKHGSMNDGFMHFDYAAFDTTGVKVQWVWETETSPFCMESRFPEKEVIALGPILKEIGEKYVQIYKDLKDEGWKAFIESRF